MDYFLLSPRQQPSTVINVGRKSCGEIDLGAFVISSGRLFTDFSQCFGKEDSTPRNEEKKWSGSRRSLTFGRRRTFRDPTSEILRALSCSSTKRPAMALTVRGSNSIGAQVFWKDESMHSLFLDDMQ
ncbi:hypothetical protein CEXT_83331 [Caerostris extrusa]|uniref:Uncharacterized protein n=1 Tax=Caerostris extrusa TaxID=172846 RepID=A0AAV4NF18_CAEEX|nr:hypothetical protein CEXT_83331 [Caerostris extrusa]